jgi:DNA-directed RNA polymerase subunit RPC12/RpoP
VRRKPQNTANRVNRPVACPQCGGAILAADRSRDHMCRCDVRVLFDGKSRPDRPVKVSTLDEGQQLEWQRLLVAHRIGGRLLQNDFKRGSADRALHFGGDGRQGRDRHHQGKGQDGNWYTAACETTTSSAEPRSKSPVRSTPQRLVPAAIVGANPCMSACWPTRAGVIR